MDLKVVLLVVFLSALAITSTNASIPSCCISTQTFMPRKLSKVERVERQYSNGVCDIDALKLYLKGRKRPVCVNVRLEKYFVRIQK
uniref:Chemokine interleukin-8-like domain-containing protein n=2 Tax=Poecilia TaxID=8080 RepID=A0A096M6Q3_POEFO